MWASIWLEDKNSSRKSGQKATNYSKINKKTEHQTNDPVETPNPLAKLLTLTLKSNHKLQPK